MNRTAVVSGLCSAAIVLAATPALGQGMPDWFNMATGRGFRKDLPDFFQHQYIGDPAHPTWENPGGWCFPTALADCLYSFKVNGYPNLFPNSNDINMNMANKWQPAACRAIEDLVNGGIFADDGIQSFLNASGYPETGQPTAGLKNTRYVVNQMTGAISYTSSDNTVKNVTGTAFDLLKKELKDGQDVLLRLAADTSRPGVMFSNGLWWRGRRPDEGNYHFVTVAGFDCGTEAMPMKNVYFADPDSNKGSTDADAGWDGKQNHAGAIGRKYGAGDNDVPIPARGPNMNDDPVMFDKFYQCVTIGADGFTMTNDAANMRYKNVTIRRVETICPVKATIKATTPDPIPSDPARTRTHTGFSSGPICTIDGILIYPAFAFVTPFPGVPTPDPTFLDPSGDLWFTQYIPPSMPDPFFNTRFRGGILFTCPDGAGMTPGELCFGDTFTSGAYVGFDLLLHVRGTGTWQNGTWQIQPILNGPESAYMPQTAICLADFNQSGAVSVQDIFDFLAAYFGSNPSADVNNSGIISVQDIFDFLGLYFTGCGV